MCSVVFLLSYVHRRENYQKKHYMCCLDKVHLEFIHESSDFLVESRNIARLSRRTFVNLRLGQASSSSRVVYSAALSRMLSFVFVALLV